jgi:hypothetical protein
MDRQTHRSHRIKGIHTYKTYTHTRHTHIHTYTEQIRMALPFRTLQTHARGDTKHASRTSRARYNWRYNWRYNRRYAYKKLLTSKHIARTRAWVVCMRIYIHICTCMQQKAKDSDIHSAIDSAIDWDANPNRQAHLHIFFPFFFCREIWRRPDLAFGFAMRYWQRRCYDFDALSRHSGREPLEAAHRDRVCSILFLGISSVVFGISGAFVRVLHRGAPPRRP